MAWLQILGAPDAQLEERLSARVAQRIADGDYSAENMEYVRRLNRPAIKGDLEMDPRRLERLRSLCGLYEVDLRPAKITSHRKFVGPFIVAAKKACYPVVRAFLKDFLRQQRAFNAAAVTLLTDLCNEKPSSAAGDEQDEH